MNYVLYDKVKIISKNTVGFIVNITRDGKYDIEKAGNEGPIYFDVEENDIDFIRN